MPPTSSRAGNDVFGFAGTGTWAEEMLVPEQGVVVIPDDVPYEIGALIGCGVTTGVGAAVNTAQVKVGSSVVVFGCGGVGISAIQGARLCGAAEIVGVDMVPSKLEDAKRFGATHGVHPDDLAAVNGEITGGEGFDYAFECIGIAPTFRAAWDATRRGGTTVIVGAGRGDAILELNGFEMFFSEKRLLGSYYGGADVRTEFHRLIRLWKAGRLDLDGMVSNRFGLEGIDVAVALWPRGVAPSQVWSSGGPDLFDRWRDPRDQGPHQAFRPGRGGAGARLHRAAGSGHRLPRAQRGRQDHHAAHPARPGGPHLGHGHHRRPPLPRPRPTRCARSAPSWRRPASTRPAGPATTCGWWRSPPASTTRRIDEVLDLVGLTDDARRRVGGFSLGMRQRLQLAERPARRSRAS